MPNLEKAWRKLGESLETTWRKFGISPKKKLSNKL